MLTNENYRRNETNNIILFFKIEDNYLKKNHFTLL